VNTYKNSMTNDNLKVDFCSSGLLLISIPKRVNIHIDFDGIIKGYHKDTNDVKITNGSKKPSN